MLLGGDGIAKMVHVNPSIHEAFMHPLKGKKQTAAHIAARMKSFRKTRQLHPWAAGRPANTPEELWSKVDRKGLNECWPWLGSINEQGYGRVEIADISYYAHRVIYNLVHPGLISLKAPRIRTAWGFLRHSCDNPICCNPKHLLVGTLKENTNDRRVRNLNSWVSGENHGNSKLTMKQAREARLLRQTGIGPTALAKKFGISLPSMKSLLRGDSYKEDD